MSAGLVYSLVSASVCLTFTVCQFVYSSVCLTFCLRVYLYVFLFVCLKVTLSICLSTGLLECLLSVYLCLLVYVVSLSVCLSACLISDCFLSSISHMSICLFYVVAQLFYICIGLPVCLAAVQSVCMSVPLSTHRRRFGLLLSSFSQDKVRTFFVFLPHKRYV